MEITVTGISHQTAPVNIREQFALDSDGVAGLLRMIRAEGDFEEALALSTCNRTEVLLVADHPYDTEARVLGWLSRLRGRQAVPADRSFFHRHDGLAAVAHVFRVAASLESQILGEHQMLGQVKEAYRAAAAAGTAGYVINRLLHRAIRVAKKVRTETDLCRGAVSVPQAAVELARQLFADLSDKTVLLVGAGKMAELAARNLVNAGAGRIIVANRTLWRAAQVAAAFEAAETSAPGEGFSANAASLDDLPALIGEVDLAICSAGSPTAVLRRDELGEAIARAGRPLLIIDIAVPRNADLALAELSNVFLYNIDDLGRLVEGNLERRRQECPRALAIIDYEVQLFSRWLNSLRVTPVVRLLQEHFDQLRIAEIKRYGRQFCDADCVQLDLFTQSLCRKMLHKPLTFLHAISHSAAPGASMAAVETIRRMFDLGPTDRQP